MTDSLCVFCGTARRGTVALCPTCGRPWIDQVPAEAAVSAPLVRRGDATVATVTKAGKTAAVPPLPAPSPPPNRTPWFIAAAVVIGAVALYVLFFGVWISGEGEVDPTAAVSVPPTAVTPTTPPATTATTAAPTTTTTTSSTTTSTTTTTLPTIPAVGDPVPLEELTLGAFALGPFDFGDSSNRALGRLVRTFGQPDAIFEAGEEFGVCPNDEGRVVRFGWLNAIFANDVLVAYRLAEPEDGSLHPTARLTTVSGARIGDSLDTLRDIYIDSNINTAEFDSGDGFILVRSGDARTLLWGPLTSTADTGRVLGIYSPLPCQGGPFLP
jgi:hypothetical protein